MGTYENFYLNQIKQLQEENKKLKQIIDEGVLDANVAETYRKKYMADAAVRDLEKKKQRDKKNQYASDDMESRRTQPGYGPSSDSPTPGPSGRLTNQRWNAGRFPNG
jgi:hypothetical protein